MPKSLFVDPAELQKSGRIRFTDIPVNQYQKPISEARGEFSDEALKRIYRDIVILRTFEHMLNQIKTQGSYNGIETTYPGPAHLSLGQESAAVGQAYLLEPGDIIFGSHRSHSEILAKSLSAIEKLDDAALMDVMEHFFDGRILRSLENIYKATDVKDLAMHFLLYGALCEIFARSNGFHMGMGGSMHAFFLPFGVYPNNAIVGGSATIATGAALYKKCNSKGGIVVCNIGDGSLGCGPVWEALNFAAMDQYKTLWGDSGDGAGGIPAGGAGGNGAAGGAGGNGAAGGAGSILAHGAGGDGAGGILAHGAGSGIHGPGNTPGGKGGLPIIFNIFNNAYGMGGQTRGETMAYDMLARIGAGIAPDQMQAERVWGHDPLAVIDVYRRKRQALAENGGPILLDVLTYRLSGHSTSDQNAYRSKEELDAWQAADPCIRYRAGLVSAGVAPDSDFEGILSEAEERMTKVCRWAADESISPYADFSKDYFIIERLMFSGEKRPSFGDGEPQALIPKEECPRVSQIKGKSRSAYGRDGKPVSKMKMYNIRDAIFEPLLDKFYEDSSLVSYGEDVRDWGGAFAVYRGLSEALPHSRLFNAPISEAAIVGTGVGYALSGGRAVVELMYCDFIGRAGDEVFNQLSKWQAMSAGILKMPVVLRVSVGSKYGAQHSQDWTALCAHIPGLKVCFPATPYEARGLMAAALNSTDPVVFFESQRIYDMGELFHEGGVPEEPYELRFGDVSMIRRGSDITIITVGATLYKAVEAAKALEEKHGLSAELINLHSLVPLDYTEIIRSVEKTGRVVLASDACARGSFLNDVARNISELCFDFLDAPPVLVGAQNWITPPFEFDEFFFPQASWILDAINDKIVPLEGHKNTIPSFMPADQIRRAKAGV